MKSYNNVTLIGRAVKTPEVKDTGSANSRAGFVLAVGRPYKDADGKRPTDFLPVVAWGKLAEICGEYISKGCLMLVSGRIQSRSYALNAETKWITEIIAESVNILEYGKAKTEEVERKAA
ncbi:MAG: single-stranded DNA-binding protein [Candidatus Margulisbacteria bacterium]|jgi:single-strand DNA-binding protein|nr:single-stranded DNA-binding protein [Candidatus Margulisiibacteriota bacterium]